MRTRVLTTADAPAWDAYLERLPGADVYHTAEYHAAHEANGDGTAMCFVAEEGENLLLHPFMVREIPGTGWRDIESVYGYSGPLAGSNPYFMGSLDALFMSDAWSRFRAWCKETNVVAEFIRFNPFATNWELDACGRGMDVTCDRYTVALDLSGTDADLWGRYPSRQRNMVRKAITRGLRRERDSEHTIQEMLPIFRSLYYDTMERNGAGSYYAFGYPYFDALADGLGDNLRLFCVRDQLHGDRIVASALFMIYRDRMHYHLAGSDAEYRSLGANNLLLHGAALWGQQHGYRWLHLGGGRTNAPDDSLLRFKASISTKRLPFYVGKRVHNQEAYERLCGEWRERHPGVDPGGYFLLWRKDESG